MTSFTQSTIVPNLYFLPASVTPAEPYCIAFWVDDESVVESDKPSLQVTWETGTGVYLFLKTSLVEDRVLSDRIREFRLTPAVSNARFLWIDNPADPVFQWKFQVLTLVPDSSNPYVCAVGRLSVFDFRNYGLAIDRGVLCRLNADHSGFVFVLSPALHLAPGEDSIESGKRVPFYFSTDYGAHLLKGIGTNPAREALALSLTGDLAGCFAFALTLHNLAPRNSSEKTAFNELTQMDITLRMFFKSANSVLDPSDPFSGFADLNLKDHFLVSNHRYPFLGEDRESASRYSVQSDGSQNLTLYATLDPLQPLNATRSYFTFVEPGDSARSSRYPQGVASLSLPSCYRTNLGYTIHVTPHGYHDSRLIFAERLGRSLNAFESPLYLVPQGNFTLSVPDYEKTPIPSGDDLSVQDEDVFLCGIAGIEYIQLSHQLSHQHINVLRFTAGQSAFTPDFVPGQIVETDQAEQQLDARAVTSWGEIAHIGRENPIYFSQPQQSLLYRASAFQDRDGDPTNDLFRFLAVPVTGLPPGKALPLFPYGGVAGKLRHYQQMEEQLLNPQRHNQIRDLAQLDTTPLRTPTVTSDSAIASPAQVTGMTAQGLLATYSSDFETLDTLLLAQDTTGENLNFRGLRRQSPLRLAFQSSQMFLVIAKKASVQDYFLSNQLTIQDWTFDLNPQNWRQGKGDTDTVLIFKSIDKPLIEALKDIALWEQPHHFVGGNPDDIKKMRDRLVEQFEEAIATVADPRTSEKARDNAAPLARIASSVSWSGMIALNVALPLAGLPSELKALECGIQDGANLYAQYLGSNGTPILSVNGVLEAQQSSLFGLLEYQDTSVPKTGTDGYAFQVASLRVQFQNSQISAFSSDLNLTLDRLFDEATQLLNSRSGRNIVLLKGFTERHDGVITYAFNFSGENYFALPKSHILNNIDIVKATFSTDPPGRDKTLTIGRFCLWGRLNFRDLKAFDGFSFGSDAGLSDQVLQSSQALNRSALTLEDDRQTGLDQLANASKNLDIALTDLAKNKQFIQFSKLTLVMECQHSEAGVVTTTFKVDSSQMIFDLARSQARAHSFYNKFPLKLANFVQIEANRPESKPKGYLPVKTPLGGGAMPNNGFGLNFELNLGSLGGLSGAAQMVASLLVVWEPNRDGSQESIKTFVGLRLPGIGGDVAGFPLQSVLKLSFKTVELLLDSSQSNPAYLLKLKKAALKFFVLSFPPNGQTEIVIFGNPDATDSNDAIGWYAAYAKEPPALSEGQSGGRSSPAKR